MISVTAPNAPTGIAELSMTVTGGIESAGPCTTGGGPTDVCGVTGGPGTYHVVLAAPGYQTSTLDFAVAGTEGGCNRCEQADTKQFSVVMQPAGPSPASRS